MDADNPASNQLNVVSFIFVQFRRLNSSFAGQFSLAADSLTLGDICQIIGVARPKLSRQVPVTDTSLILFSKVRSLILTLLPHGIQDVRSE